MLKHLSEIRKADIVTVHNGFVQAINGPIAYLGYLPNLEKVSFAVDAEIFASALKDLDDDFMVKVFEEEVLIFDSEREIKFISKGPEQLLEIPQSAWIMRDITHMWQLTDKFVTAQYPGIRVTRDYFETISDQSILRVSHHLEIDQLGWSKPVFSRCKVTSKSIAYCLTNSQLWLQYDNSNFIVISKLGVEFPNTDDYFRGTLRYKQIPNLKEKLLPCDIVKFENNNLILIKEGAAKATIENVEGRGVYDFKLFNKVIQNAVGWQMTDTAMFFTGANFRGVIENVEHHAI